MLRLLHRPSLTPGTWWDGYVVHVLAENGHAPTRDYMQDKLERFVSDLVPTEMRLKALAGNPIGEALRTFSDYAFPAWAVRGLLSATAYCPCCYRIDPIVKLSWRLRVVTHCAEHHRALQTTCQSCGTRVLHWDLARRSCRCGAALYMAPIGIGAEDGSSLDEGRELWIFSSQFTSTLVTCAESGGIEHHRQMLALVVFLGRLLPTLAAIRVSRTEHDGSVSGFLKWLKLKVEPSSKWVGQLWEELPSAAHLRNALNEVLKLLRDEQATPSELSTLPLFAWAQALCKLGASPVRAERRGWVAPGLLQPGLVPAKVAARRAGLSEMHLHRLMGKGLVVPAGTFSLGKRQHLFSEDQVRALERFRHKGYGYGMALDLGVEGNGLRVLRCSTILSIVAGNGGLTWLDGGELRALLADLARRAVEVEKVDGAKLSLGSKRVWQFRYIPALKTMFSRLRDGEFKLWANGNAPGLARFFIGTDSLGFLHRGVVGGGSGSASAGVQHELPLADAQAHWLPTPPPWRRPPPARRPRVASPRPSQLTLDAV